MLKLKHLDRALQADQRLKQAENNEAGPRGSYGCACMDRDSVQCAAIRYGMDHWGEPCECLCHQWSDDDEYQH